MNSQRHAVQTLSGLMFLAGVCWSAIALAQAPGGGPVASTAEGVTRHLDLLQSGSKEERQIAEDWLLNTPPDALPFIQAAAKDRGNDPDTGRRLASIVGRLQVLARSRRSTEKSAREESDWNLRTSLDAYNRFGHHDPKWDDEARKGITLFVTPGRQGEAFDVLEHVTSILKCDDPFVLYLDARLLEGRAVEAANDRQRNTNLVTSAINTYVASSKFFEKTDYPASRKCFAWFHTVACIYGSSAKDVPEMKANAASWADKAVALWPQVLAEPGISTRFLLDIGAGILDAQVKCSRERGPVTDEMFTPFEKAFPKSPAPLVFKGQAYIDYAWDARGYGFAQTVTPAKAALFQERLASASEMLEKAYALDPSDPRAAVAMCHVELGQGRGRDVLNKWFDRAIAAHPDADLSFLYPGNRDAYGWKLEYLQTRWYGSIDDSLAFGRECLATRNWHGNVANMPVRVHEELARFMQGPAADAYWHNKLVWSDIDAAVGPPARMYPESASWGSLYAWWAFRCGQWKVADSQFKRLGDKLEVARFGGPEKAEAARKEAAQRAGE
jgi:hypothetical protein